MLYEHVNIGGIRSSGYRIRMCVCEERRDRDSMNIRIVCAITITAQTLASRRFSTEPAPRVTKPNKLLISIRSLQPGLLLPPTTSKFAGKLRAVEWAGRCSECLLCRVVRIGCCRRERSGTVRPSTWEFKGLEGGRYICCRVRSRVVHIIRAGTKIASVPIPITGLVSSDSEGSSRMMFCSDKQTSLASPQIALRADHALSSHMASAAQLGLAYQRRISASLSASPAQPRIEHLH
ncbi:hypothetical protein P171DRAFT_474048 [Karstenula rhodostoma CBS 690.94]|uniref:Uncharacterized protein n=1 Tax=Karstenula rhodostoma CBS 690.94 TaxID=1392251 RepID=A0A9P4PGS9_9PLEO|nr:hypothetical protein P171DRAFT_474048 [Karstenula rhodostoma CBS 690.94]